MTIRPRCIELHYLPCIAYFAAIQQAEVLYLEAHETFQKQSYRNRCYLATSQGRERLTVPVLKANRHTPIRAVEIDYREPWHIKQWRTWQTAYAKAPFFEFYADSFWEVLQRRPRFLFDLNEQFLTVCLYHLNLSPTIRHTDSYQREISGAMEDLRDKIHPKRTNGIIHAKQYVQVFGGPFQENLSILDLLFCEGPHALPILQATHASFHAF